MSHKDHHQHRTTADRVTGAYSNPTVMRFSDRKRKRSQQAGSTTRARTRRSARRASVARRRRHRHTHPPPRGSAAETRQQHSNKLFRLRLPGASGTTKQHAALGERAAHHVFRARRAASGILTPYSHHTYPALRRFLSATVTYFHKGAAHSRHRDGAEARHTTAHHESARPTKARDLPTLQ